MNNYQMMESYKHTIEWCNAEEKRINANPDYWRNILTAGRMMAIWKISADAQDKLDKIQLVYGLPWSAQKDERAAI